MQRKKVVIYVNKEQKLKMPSDNLLAFYFAVMSEVYFEETGKTLFEAFSEDLFDKFQQELPSCFRPRLKPGTDLKLEISVPFAFIFFWFSHRKIDKITARNILKVWDEKNLCKINFYNGIKINSLKS